YTYDKWEAVKPKIQQLYVQDEKTLQQVIRILQRDHGFAASEKQLKSRIATWGFDVKNIKGHTMVRMARARLKRKREGGKDSIFLVNNRQVPDRNINRYLKRKRSPKRAFYLWQAPL
ncbi:hypothetical protein L207DRAFT_383028, partial [Hyaloscypha variabilis F]